MKCYITLTSSYLAEIEEAIAVGYSGVCVLCIPHVVPNLYEFLYIFSLQGPSPVQKSFRCIEFEVYY